MKKDRFIFFWRENEEDGYLSQWYPSPFTVEGIEYATAEQYMMAKKALLFGDLDTYLKIMNESDPSAVKKLGKEVAPFDPDKWDSSKREILFQGNLAKFSQNPELNEKLRGTDVFAKEYDYSVYWK